MDKIFGIAVKAMIKNKKGKFLVIFKSGQDEINPNQVDIPGGRLEFGENVESCLKREVKEELNIEIEIEKPSRTWNLIKNNLHLVGITFLAKYVGGELRLSGEHTKYEWVDKDKILNGDYPEWIKEEFKVI